MSIEIEIGKYSDNKDLGGFEKMKFSSIDEAISTLEFLKLGYNYFKNGESLVVRVGQGTKPHLIDYDSIIPIAQLRQELEEKYNKEISEDDEIEFTITEKPQKEKLNSNFVFSEDNETSYAKTSTGETLPFKLFRTDDTDTGSNLLRESPDSGKSSDFALIERRFSENTSLQFFGTEKIESLNDIAWLFKSLEDEAVEHAFLVYDFEDNGYFIQHISTGSFNAALIDNRQIIGNVIEANPKSVTLVHNHPSGNLHASKADIFVLERIKKALQNTDVNVNDGIIINLRSGNYLVFNEKLYEEKKQRVEDSKKLEGIQAYSFSKQVLVQNFQPIQVNSPYDVAAYITSQKFGVSDKNEMLVLNPQLSIVAKFILPANNQENFIIEKVSKFGGTSCVLYGNNISPELVDFYSKKLENSNITITDAILFKSENGQKMWESFMNEDKMQQNNNADTLKLNENNQSILKIMEKELSWSDRVITPKTKAYKDFVKEKENTSPERWFRDGERIFTDQEKKFMQIYNNKNGIKEASVASVQEVPARETDVENKKIEISKTPELEKKQITIDQSEEKEVVGKITHYNLLGKILDVKNYTSSESYLNAVEGQQDRINFKNETLLRDPKLLKDVDDLKYRARGENNPNSLEYYAEKEFNIPTISEQINLSEKQKEIFLEKGFINIPNEKHEDELKVSLSMTKDGKISGTWYTGEEFIIRKEDLFPKLVIQKENNQIQKLQEIAGSLASVSSKDLEKVSTEALLELKALKEYNVSDEMRADNFSTIKLLREDVDRIDKIISDRNNNTNIQSNIMENQKDFDQVQYSKDQLKYLGFGEGEKLHKDLETGINSPEKNFEIQTFSDKALPGNNVEFTIKYGKSEQGGIFLNSYDATLTNDKAENISQNFKVSKDNSFTAKEAVNLLEGRSVKIEFNNPKTDQKEQAFVKLNLAEEKNQYGNYNFQTFHQNYGVDVPQIVEKTNLIFDKPEYKDSTIKSLEKGNIVKVKFEMEDKIVEGKAVLNPQYKTLNLYDSEMNRINTNKPLQGVDNDSKHEKSNVREQSKSRGI